MNQLCLVCKHWRKDEPFTFHGYGECHRRSPVVQKDIMVSSGNGGYLDEGVGIFPKTDAENGCSEFECKIDRVHEMQQERTDWREILGISEDPPIEFKE